MAIKGNKRFRQVLLAVGVLVWGLVAYRFISAFLGGSEGRVVTSGEVERDTAADLQGVVPDTYELRLDYEDPFLKGDVGGHRSRRRTRPLHTMDTDPSSGKGKKGDQKQDKEKGEEDSGDTLQWPRIRYGGMIRNRSAKEAVALLGIGDKERLLSPGDEWERIRLEELWEDSVRIAFQGEERTFTKRSMAYEKESKD